MLVSDWIMTERIVFLTYTREVFAATQHWTEAHKIFPERPGSPVGYDEAALVLPGQGQLGVSPDRTGPEDGECMSVDERIERPGATKTPLCTANGPSSWRREPDPMPRSRALRHLGIAEHAAAVRRAPAQPGESARLRREASHLAGVAREPGRADLCRGRAGPPGGGQNYRCSIRGISLPPLS